MFQMLTIGGVKRHERTTHMNPLTPGGIPLKIEGVSKIFPGRTGVVEALRPVNVEVQAGEFVCLLGPSGCGKSTLLSIIAGLESATEGVVLADRRIVPGPRTIRLSANTTPSVADSSPAIILSSVDLPQPLGPSKQTNSPACTSTFTGRNASTTPVRPGKILLTPSIFNGIPPGVSGFM